MMKKYRLITMLLVLVELDTLSSVPGGMYPHKITKDHHDIQVRLFTVREQKGQ